jgi:O-antigen ligase
MPPSTRDRALSVVLVAGVALVLWRGGFDDAAHLIFAALGAAAWLIARRPVVRDWVAGGLMVAAAAVFVSLLAHVGEAGAQHASAVVSLPLWYLAATAAGEPVRRVAALGIIVVSCTAAVAGLGALAVRSAPYAERIDGIWRAGGTLENPTALAVLCLAALALVLALTAAGELTFEQAAVPGLLLVAAIAGSFDRLAAVGTAVALALFWWRIPEVRRLVAWLSAAALAVALIALAAARPPLHEFGAHVGHDPLAGRTDVWRDAWDAILDRPSTGVGPGRYSSIIQPDSKEARLAHDEPLQLGVEAGIVAGAGVLIAIAAVLVRAARGLVCRDAGRLGWACAGGIVALSAFYDFTWSFPPLALIALLGAAALQKRATP